MARGQKFSSSPYLMYSISNYLQSVVKHNRLPGQLRKLHHAHAGVILQTHRPTFAGGDTFRRTRRHRAAGIMYMYMRLLL